MPFGRDQKADQGLSLIEMFGVRGDAGSRGIQDHTHALILLVRQERSYRRLRMLGQVTVDVIMIDRPGGHFPACHGCHDLPIFPVHECPGILL